MDSTRPILVPLDGSQLAENALPVAALLSRAFGLPLRFVHVVDEGEGAWTMDDVAAARERFVPYVRELADRHGLAIDEGAVEVGWGRPAPVILSLAAEASFVVIATHGHGGFKATFIGSVTDKVVRGAHVPVVAVPGVEPRETFAVSGPVVVALDGSEEAERALALAREVAGAIGARVVLVRAYHMPPPVGIEFAAYPPFYETTLEEAARHYLEGVAAPGEEWKVLLGAPADAIQQVAEEADATLIALASTGKSLAKRVALGSTTDRVLHSLRRPLLIVPPPGGE